MEDEVPKVLATFNAYDQDEIDLFGHATGYMLTVWDVGNHLREIEKWRLDSFKSPSDLLDEIRDYFYETKEKYHLPQD